MDFSRKVHGEVVSYVALGLVYLFLIQPGHCFIEYSEYIFKCIDLLVKFTYDILCLFQLFLGVPKFYTGQVKMKSRSTLKMGFNLFSLNLQE